MNRNMQRLRRRGVRCACRKREASFAERSFRRTAAEGSFRVGVPKSVGGSFRNSVTACVSVPGSSPLKDFEVYERLLLRKSQRAFIYEARWYRDDDRPLHDTCRGRFLCGNEPRMHHRACTKWCKFGECGTSKGEALRWTKEIQRISGHTKRSSGNEPRMHQEV